MQALEESDTALLNEWERTDNLHEVLTTCLPPQNEEVSLLIKIMNVDTIISIYIDDPYFLRTMGYATARDD